ncbi:hypothetical protein Adt_27553 [Abeliophyllum distichum]|uniref:Uncharacterized protein n=1 Tax=Abeliophyllum distichum TaxID=126358 RepID=A0ABD1RU18_9LAMI
MERLKATIEIKVVNQNVLDNGEKEDIETLKEKPLKEKYVGKSKFEHRKNDEDEDDDNAGRLVTIQFGTMLPVIGNNYLLANEFKNKEHDDEIMEENEDSAYMLYDDEIMANNYLLA